MSRSTVFILGAVSLFFLVVPLTLPKPGLPVNLKADEAAYYLMALSLVRDGDLLVEEKDIERVFLEFPYMPVRNLVVMSDDGWQTVYFSKPVLYPLLAAPFVGLFGANGMVFLNMALLLGMVWLGSFYLSRFNPEGLSVLFSGGFFLLSSGFVYVFWLQTEVFGMAAVMLACFLVLYPLPEARIRPMWWSAVSGIGLGMAVYNKPMFLALALPLLWSLWKERRWSAGSWTAGLAGTLVLSAALSFALVGKLHSHIGPQERTGVTVCEPGVMPIGPQEGEASVGRLEARAAAASTTGNTFSWLARVPDLNPSALWESIRYFLWGRHTGFFLYLPFAGLCILYFALEAPRDASRWLILISVAIVALYFLLEIPQNWQGGGGFIGNRYFITVYPAFLFLVGRLRPSFLVAPFFGIAGLFLGPLLLSPFSPGGPEPTLQAHVRNAPFRFFPLELSLRHLPGYHRQRLGSLRYYARRDQVLPRGSTFWMRGADRVEVQFLSSEQLGPLVFEIKSLARHNRVRVRFGSATSILEATGTPRKERVVLEAGEPQQVLWRDGEKVYVYRLVVETSNGVVRPWTRFYPPSRCAYFPVSVSSLESFFVGAEVTLLGGVEALERDVFGLRWGEVLAPESVEPGASFQVEARVRNRSSATWESDSLTPVSMSYHWLGEDGAVLVRDGLRTPFSTHVEPGEGTRLMVNVVAPSAPGTYVLELDPVFENVAWFSERNGASTSRHTVRVEPRSE